jgi:hypothetical protein
MRYGGSSINDHDKNKNKVNIKNDTFTEIFGLHGY